jgi:predicted acyltransferase
MSNTNSNRLLSLDTLRGFDMLWIIGATEIIRVLGKSYGWFPGLVKTFSHAEWIGLHAYDMIFPLFMFISGVAIPFSILRRLESGVSKKEIILKAAKRAIILIIFGIIYNGTLSFEKIRIPGVLGQIGIAYFFATLIMVNTKSIKQQIFWLAGLFAGVSALQLFFPVPGSGMGVFTPTGAINAWLDGMLIPFRADDLPNDPEGFLCSISAIGITLMGAIAGEILKSEKYSGNRKTMILLIAGLALMVFGFLVSPVYPIIKKAWTTTFNLTAGGISMMLMAIFYWIIDVKNKQGWTLFFRVIGLNSITIYLMARLVSFRSISEFFLGGIANKTGINHQLLIVIGMLTIEWLVLYFFYKKKIFLRV